MPEHDAPPISYAAGDRFAGGATNRPEVVFRNICLLAVILPLVLLGVLVIDVLNDGWGKLTEPVRVEPLVDPVLGPQFDDNGDPVVNRYQFMINAHSETGENAGVYPALIGSIWLLVLTMLLAVPIGVGAAVYLEEYAQRSKLTALIEININNLAGVPSIIYGLLGLEVFVRVVGMGRSVLAGAATLALLLLPMVITASREALRTVPRTLREAAWALGGERFRTIRTIVLPMSLPGILTGTILSLARAIGETAPLIVVGALTLAAAPKSIHDAFSALPIAIYEWVQRPDHAFQSAAAAGIIVLLTLMLLLNGLAIWLRARMQRRIYW